MHKKLNMFYIQILVKVEDCEAESVILFSGKYRGFGGLGVAFWPLVPKFAGSNPAEAVGFLRAK